MSKKFYSLFLTLLTAFLWLGSGTAWGETLTVAETPTTTSDCLPLYGYYGDTGGTKSQVIYSSDLLEGMAGGTITAMKFYASTSSASWSGTWAVTLGTTSSTSLSGIITPSSSVEVYKGTLSVSSNEMTITFSEAFEYSGDENLVVEIALTKTGNCPEASFRGISATGVGWCSKKYSAQNVLPKVTFTYTPGSPATCPKTGVPSYSSVTTSAATISWAQGGTEDTWNLHYKKSNADSWTEVSGLKNTSYNLTGLSGGTTYKYEVQADCGGGELSGWKAGTDFTTDCGTATLPFEPVITAGSKPNCWTIADASWGDAWSGRWYTYLVSGSNCLRYQASSSSAETAVTTPSINITGPAKLRFDYQNYNGSRRVPSYVTISNSTTTKKIQLSTEAPNSMVADTIDLTDVDGADFTNSTITIAFSAKKHSSSSGTGYFWVKNIKVFSDQDCSAPQNVTLSGSSISTADFTWDANTGVDSYKYCVVAQGEEADWSGDLSVNTNSVHVESLTPGNYTFYVKCGCGTAAASLDFEIVSCPTVTSVTLSNQVWNGVTVNWTTSATTNCDVQYKIGEGVWTEYESNISATSKSFSGLVPGTEYSFRVKPHCSADGWVSPALPTLRFARLRAH